MKKKSNDKISKLNRMLEIPEEIYLNVPKITITAFEQMVIENFKGILNYEDYFIRINTEIGIISINGYNLKMENMNNNDVKVIGNIDSIELEKNED